jgi:predicted RNase H-like HicB family nuclease
MELTVSIEREDDGRWLAEVPQLRGVLAYGASQAKAMTAAAVLALRVLADRIEQSEMTPGAINIVFRTGD